jgi:hypothetical protein
MRVGIYLFVLLDRWGYMAWVDMGVAKTCVNKLADLGWGLWGHMLQG